ncbi:DNL-type zinc finger protein-like [Temnothorax curvispinosus]|uniref:DNL-type zinc finger protein-like n=1 Tax=Temnothorax curvispinosus TaxID=300111 RepID=A0A6J1QJJ6_9HYME|nr:DNL-type zinc finger protein-like [Temnothorax curvispinosus]
MFSIRQALRLGARVACARHAACCYAPALSEPTGIRALRHVRLAHEDGSNRGELGKLEGKMRLMFTCTKCNTRTSKLISKLAYDKGVVIVRCDGCKNNHLIADNLGWFSQIDRKINIEKLMALKGETVRKVMNDTDGYYEAVLKEEFKLQNQKDASEIKVGDEHPDEIKVIGESKGS